MEPLQNRQCPCYQACENVSQCPDIFKSSLAKELDLLRDLILSLKKAWRQSLGGPGLEAPASDGDARKPSFGWQCYPFPKETEIRGVA